jgi:hypothetical protein
MAETTMSGADFSLSGSAARWADLVAASHSVAVGLEAPLAAPPRLRACAHCGAGILPRAAQRFCSRSCAGLARPGRPSLRRRKRAGTYRNDPLILRLLELSPFEQAPDGRWRFGTRAISEKVVARLIAGGRAEIQGDRLLLRQRAPE